MKIALHRIGNKISGEGASFSDEELQITEEKQELLQNYFLGSFKSEETFQFYSDSYLSQNIVFNLVSDIFENKETLLEKSINIGRQLYEAAENPRIQGGELFVVYFEAENENDVDKVGIFKTERREPFLKFFQNESDPIEVDRGISLVKIDKAALVYNIDKESGYVLQVLDNNKNGDVYYWFEDFLKVKQRTDDYFHTQESLCIFKDYVKKQLPQEFEVTKADLIDFLNKSLNYFKEKEEFKLDDFAAEVLEDQHVIENFVNYKTDYEQEMQVNIAEEFQISKAAVKKTQRHFKSIIKLDKNFHLYIHGDKRKLVEGTDENGKFYKIYFENES